MYKKVLEQLHKTEGYEFSSHVDDNDVLHIMAHDQEGNKVGHAKFSHDKTRDKYMQANRQEFGIKGLMPEHTEVHENHRRRGIASEMYRRASLITGQKVVRPPVHNQTPDARKLWAAKKFRKNENWKKRIRKFPSKIVSFSGLIQSIQFRRYHRFCLRLLFYPD